MPLIKNLNTNVFDLDSVNKGDLIYAEHSQWDEARKGIVTRINESAITVQYVPPIANITNHFVIQVADVVAGAWQIRWSGDLKEIFSWGGNEDD